MRRSLAVVTLLGAVTLGTALGGRTPAGAATSPSSKATVTTEAVAPSSGILVKTIRLRQVGGKGAKRLYEATVLTNQGTPLDGAEVSINGLTSNPDERVVTTKMTGAGKGIYRAVVVFPNDGDWVLQVQTHKPEQNVGLFVEKIAGTGTAANRHVTDSPAQRALTRDDPTFAARYNPYNSQPGILTADAQAQLAADAASGHGGHEATTSTGGTPSIHADGLQATTVAFALLHTLGALAWMVSVLGLVLANRLGPGAGRNALVAFIARRYTVLAGGGLLVLVLSGISNAQHASPGLWSPSTLLDSRIGVAYLAVFGFKMVLVLGSIVTSVRIGRRLPSVEHLVRSARVASVGAAADDAPDATLLSLAEANAVLGGLIIVAVAVLSQLHHVLH